MNFKDLKIGQNFIFADRVKPTRFVCEYRGNGWYSYGEYTGGPYHRHDNPQVKPQEQFDGSEIY